MLSTRPRSVAPATTTWLFAPQATSGKGMSHRPDSYTTPAQMTTARNVAIRSTLLHGSGRHTHSDEGSDGAPRGQ